MNPISLRLEEDERIAAARFGERLGAPDVDKRISNGESRALRTLIRRYLALCGLVKLPPSEWNAVRDDMDQGGVLKELV